MNSGAPGWGYWQSGYRRLDHQATSASRWSHRVKRPSSGSERRLTTDEACYALPPSQRSVTSCQSFDSLVNPQRFRVLKGISDRFGAGYDGKAHGKFATEIKNYTTSCQRPLSLCEQNCLMPWLAVLPSPRHWNWRSLTTVFHSLTAAGAFTPRSCTDQAVTNAQATALTGLLDAVRHQCQQTTDASGIDVRGLANLLWAMAKLIDNGRCLTLEMKETVAALLPHVVVLNEQFIPQHISTLLWTVAKLVESSQEQVTEFKKLLVVLLPRVHALKDQFNAWGITNLLWAVAKLADHGYGQTEQLQAAVFSLLPKVCALKERFIAQGVANLLWALAKLTDNGQVLTSDLSQALSALLPRVIVMKGQFNPQHITNLLWAMAKLVDHEQMLILQFDQAVAALLPRVRALQAHLEPQEVSNLLWAMVKLVERGQELTPELQKTVVTLLPSVSTFKDQFIPQHVTNLMWALAKLVDSGQKLTPGLKKSVAALLPYVSRMKDKFIAQGIANLLWAMAKLLDNGYEWTPMLKEASVSLLPAISTYKDQFIPQHIANLLWAMAKLLDNGQELTPEFKVAVATVLPSLRIYKEQFIPQHIANLLWAMGSLGDVVVTAATDSVVESMLRLSDDCLLFARQELVMSLWGLLVCRARLYLANSISEQNNTLEYLIDRLFAYLANASIDDKQSKSVMALAASWLERPCPVDPHYQTANSVTQSVFYAQLQSALPSLQIEQEKSLHFLPPVDLLLPEHRIAIEIQGPSHYVGRDFQTRNGSTLLKTALLQKAGYDVLEIPVTHLPYRDLVETYIDQIQRKMIDMSVDDDVRRVSGREWAFSSA